MLEALSFKLSIPQKIKDTLHQDYYNTGKTEAGEPLQASFKREHVVPKTCPGEREPANTKLARMNEPRYSIHR